MAKRVSTESDLEDSIGKTKWKLILCIGHGKLSYKPVLGNYFERGWLFDSRNSLVSRVINLLKKTPQ